MIKVVNNIIPVKGKKAMTIWPFLFIRKDERMTRDDDNHEDIHSEQQMEVICIAFLLIRFLSLVFDALSMWWVFVSPTVYYALYGLEYAFRRIVLRNDANTAYKSVSFEREAYENETNYSYIKNRSMFAFIKYLKK